MKKPDVAILGAGLMGSLLAWRLAKAGLKVAIFEQSADGHQASAAWAAAAMLAPLAESAVADDFVVALGHASLPIWRTWLDELPIPVFFQQSGTLMLWHLADCAEAQRFERLLNARAPAQQVEKNFRKLSSAQSIAQYEPALGNRFEQAYLLHDEAQLDNRQLLKALLSALRLCNVPIHYSQVIDQHRLPDAKLVLDCRGLGAKEIFQDLRGVRGEVIRVHAPNLEMHRPIRLLHPRYPLYIAPKPDHLFVIGATEIESEDFSPVSVRSALELLSAAFSLCSEFAEARIIELSTQCRPTLPDHRPVVAYFGAHYLAINGLYRHGYLIAPAIVEEMISLVELLFNGKIDPSESLQHWRDQAKWPMLYRDGLSCL